MIQVNYLKAKFSPMVAESPSSFAVPNITSSTQSPPAEKGLQKTWKVLPGSPFLNPFSGCLGERLKEKMSQFRYLNHKKKNKLSDRLYRVEQTLALLEGLNGVNR